MASLDHVRFFRAALRRPASVGAVAPSSAALARVMIRGIEPDGDGAVVEFGPGTGPITRELHRSLADRAAYLGIELDGEFVRLLSRRFPEFRFVEGSAENVEQHVSAAGHRRVAAIISGLPFASLPPRVQDGVIEALDRLMRAGTIFRTFQYVHAWPLPTATRFRRLMNHRFGRCHVSRPVLANLPPALVLSWRR